MNYDLNIHIEYSISVSASKDVCFFIESFNGHVLIFFSCFDIVFFSFNVLLSTGENTNHTMLMQTDVTNSLVAYVNKNTLPMNYCLQYVRDSQVATEGNFEKK